MVVLFGEMIFNHLSLDELAKFKTDSDNKAVIYNLQMAVKVRTAKEASKVVEALEYEYDAWLIPDQFNGEVVCMNGKVERQYNLLKNLGKSDKVLSLPQHKND